MCEQGYRIVRNGPREDQIQLCVWNPGIVGVWSHCRDGDIISCPKPVPSPPVPPAVPRHECPDTCIGTLCEPHGLQHKAPDGTIWHAEGQGATFPVDCEACRCTLRESCEWPVKTCTTIEIPTRDIFFKHDYGAEHGFGSRVNGMLVEAPGAALRGHGFQMSSHTCPIESRGQANCFFQPASHCGAEVKHVGLELTEGMAHEVPRNRAQSEAMQLCRLLEPGVVCSNPLIAWRRVARVVLKVQPDVQVAVDAFLTPFRTIMEGTYGALHIRRTDKSLEATFVSVCQYTSRLAALSGQRRALSVFVATDDLATVDEVLACPESQRLAWRVVHAEDNPARGIQGNVTYRLWAEITLLTRATWAVGTFSSNVGRLLVQVLRRQDEASFQSVDYPQSAAHFPRAA